MSRRRRAGGGRAAVRRSPGLLRAVWRLSVGGWVACAATGLVITASLTAYAGYYGVSGNIATAHVDTGSWEERPERVEGVHNILVMGSDVRTGENAEYGSTEGIRPDVMIVASVDADKGAVTLMNLPRDLMTDIPPCDPAGEGFPGTPGVFDQLNHAMAYGGVECQWKTVEEITGVRLDHFAMMDFAGFKDIVDAVGGVPMCVPQAVDDPKARLRLEAGEQVLDGEQALGLARSRDSTEFGSDLGRIENQQRMMGAIARKVTSGEILSSPTAVYAFLDAVTGSLTTDDGLTVDAMADLAVTMRDVDLERVSFVTPPLADYPADTDKVVLVEEPANRLFAAIAEGEVLPEEEAEATAGGDEEESGGQAGGEDSDGAGTGEASVVDEMNAMTAAADEQADACAG
ncbi:LCP family protein [Actinorugispora endophytica]|uniref:LytR family transcriptional attenuator n=1 Tax=Actinorugispora endophytica TaxID=1605990 RepID=A0A4R6V2V5_9ACTN|nr:LCP family protein [Actinorugispora endophytica]TDQ52983.1 LytR family transcriptional attenuator [Actinorugispora endophytica]